MLYYTPAGPAWLLQVAHRSDTILHDFPPSGAIKFNCFVVGFGSYCIVNAPTEMSDCAAKKSACWHRNSSMLSSPTKLPATVTDGLSAPEVARAVCHHLRSTQQL